MNKAIFLDRDGTINVDYGYVHEKDKLEFIPGVIDGLRLLEEMGYLLIIVTNQSGIGRGMFDIDTYNDFNNYMIKKLKEENVHITDVYMCPHIDEDNCECRKPKLKLFYDAVEKYDIDLTKSFAIGDKTRDLSLCNKENIQGILLTEDNKDGYICKKDLYEAALFIKSNDKQLLLR